MKVLLVEPDVPLADVYRQALAADGHQVTVARTAQTAVHAADAGRPALVILELQLVSHSGIEFLYEFRSYGEWQAIPVIVFSQVPRGEFADSAPQLLKELGIVGYLYKPRTTLADLRRAVAALAPAAFSRP